MLRDEITRVGRVIVRGCEVNYIVGVGSITIKSVDYFRVLHIDDAEFHITLERFGIFRIV